MSDNNNNSNAERPRPLSLALPGSSLGFGAMMDDHVELSSSSSTTASRQPAVPTSASSSSFLLPPSPLPTSSAASSAPQPSSPGSTSAPSFRSSGLNTSTTPTSAHFPPSTTASGSSPTAPSYPPPPPPPMPKAPSTSRLAPLSTTSNLNIAASPISSPTTNDSAFLSPLAYSPSIAGPPEHSVMPRRSTDSSRPSPTASPAPLPMLMISDALRDASGSHPPSSASEAPLQYQQAFSHSHVLAHTQQASVRRLPSAAELPFALIRPEVQLQVFPLAENITMFGSTQTTSNYSISGKCVLSIAPNPGGALANQNQPQTRASRDLVSAPPASASSPSLLSVAAAHHPYRARSPSPLVTSSSANEPGTEPGSSSTSTRHSFDATTVRAVDGGGDSTDPRPIGAVGSDTESGASTLRVTSLKASFRGYALYMDHTARFSALKLADVEQECLPDGAVLPFPLSLPDPSSPHQTARKQKTSRYEIEFDLSVPGWLPASLRSRFGGNFYCVSAVATLSDGRVVRTEEPSESEMVEEVLERGEGEGSTPVMMQSPLLGSRLPGTDAGGADGLPQGSTPTYAEAVPITNHAQQQPVEGLPLSQSTAADLTLSSPQSAGLMGNSSSVNLRERVDFPLPPPPPPLTVPRLPSARPASYAPGSQHTIDYERGLPPIVGDGRRGMPASASLGVLDTAAGRHSTSSVPSPAANHFLRSEEAGSRSPAAAAAASAAATGSHGSSPSALQRLKSFRQGRQSAAAAHASTSAAPSGRAHSPTATRADANRPPRKSGEGMMSELPEPGSSASRVEEPPSPSLTVNNDKKGSKPRSSWLSKRAKQLSLNTHSSKSSTTATGGESSASGSSNASASVPLPNTASPRSSSRHMARDGPGVSASPSQSSFRDDPFRRARSSERAGRPSMSDSVGLLRPSATSNAIVSSGGEAQRAESASGRPSLSVRTTTKGKREAEDTNPFVEEQSDGSLRVKSEPKVIVIRRCRDVVPVSMARVAQPGVDGLNVPAGDAAAARPGGSSATARTRALPQREVPARLGSNEVLSTAGFGRQTRAAIIDESEGANHTGPDVLREEIVDAEPDVHPLERRERERAEMLEDDGMHDGDDVGEVSGVDAPVSTATATPAHAPGQGPDAGESNNAANNIPAMLPPAPSAFNAPSDPHKLAAMASAARNAASNGLRSGNRRAGGPSGSSSGGGRSGATSTSGTAPNGAPMRHFLHRPVLHAPAESNIEGDGLPFALTLSLPSHVHVEGATSDVLTFGLQIEVGRSPGWSRVRELGGLRLRDMELVCLQTERHSSAASRTFCNAFALPPDPQLAPEDVPKLPDPMGSTRKPYPPSEHRLRQGYDRDILENHIRMVQTGNVPNSRENNVERSRTTIVGPPPLAQRNAEGGSEQPDPKDRKGKKVSRGDGQPKSKKESRKSIVLPNLPDPLDLSNNGRGNGEGSSGSRDVSGGGRGESSATLPSTPTTTSNKPLSRGRRAYANAMNRLSHFASAMLDGGNDSDHGGAEAGGGDPSHSSRRGPSGSADRSASGNGHRRDKDGSGADQPRATYSFSGEDGNGVDLTKGRVRMTINLPLVPSNAEKARDMGAVQLIPDYESPFVRIRHKLKVKLGFGFGGSPLGGEGWWGQALVMCVPVRFTDSPPAEIRPAAITAGPQTTAQSISTTSGATASIAPIIETIATTMPVLPAYTQLFREDGSRLGDEAEDLPQYPGMPEGSSTAEGAAEGTTGTLPRRPSLLRHQRGSITGPQPATDDPTSNRILPSRVVDEAAPNNGTDAQAQEAAARELAEMSDVGEAAEEEDDDDGIESDSDHDDTEDVDGEDEVEGEGRNGQTPGEETNPSEDVSAQDMTEEEEEEEEPDRALPNSSADEAFLKDDDSQPESVKGKKVAHADILHDAADEGDPEDLTESKAASQAPEHFHGKESRWALTGQAEELRPRGVGSPEG
ncbi:hypothetical protein A4X13_0g4683 [Tilletia indica]|uniref:Uncharacterized protein n=1 Tax=Tilletia indica TaxID=43049 RepID=A0A177TNV6_9BASI|nr:hypothetical protein A4X13_0g4683 [Tilletia indica]